MLVSSNLQLHQARTSNVWAQVVNVIQVQDEDCRGNVERTGAGVIDRITSNRLLYWVSTSEGIELSH